MSQAVCSLFQVTSCEPSDLWTKANRVHLASSKHRRAHLAKFLAERFEVPSLSQSKILQLQEEVLFWGNCCTELEEEAKGFLREDDINTF